MTAPRISIQREGFDIAAESARLKEGGDVGAVVTFTGVCRSEDGTLEALELEHYPGMAEAEIGRIARDAFARWPLSGVTVIHRYGLMRPGDDIVLVATASTHRHAAFQAAEFLMDFMKSRAPFWKKQHPSGDESGQWVDARDTDQAALSRWDAEE
ncbi:MAG: molybdenum cofactor biosynthesis protein MoaE [Rhizobiaceae bacterium]|nr:molybdenum cofactor biosynthesis protein MoaE [Rhizobiaceae bacterium]MCV0406467.1 molybdenum cofactor biosynthesis protein MoaE [Rhizobiaceae bacterium]